MTTLTIHSGELKDEGEGPDGWSYVQSDTSVGIYGDYVYHWHDDDMLNYDEEGYVVEVVADHVTSERISDWKLATKAFYYCQCGAALIWRYEELDPIDV